MYSLPYNQYSNNKKDLILKLNIEAPIKLIEEISKNMLKKGNGRILNNASVAGYTGHPDIIVDDVAYFTPISFHSDGDSGMVLLI